MATRLTARGRRLLAAVTIAAGVTVPAAPIAATLAYHDTRPNVTAAPTAHRERALWTASRSRAHARTELGKRGWADEWACLNELWRRESNWRSEAYNPVKVDGRNAGGIPQVLGLNPNSHPTHQIKRGLDYIAHRYGTPCRALAHHNLKGWY